MPPVSRAGPASLLSLYAREKRVAPALLPVLASFRRILRHRQECLCHTSVETAAAGTLGDTSPANSYRGWRRYSRIRDKDSHMHSAFIRGNPRSSAVGLRPAPFAARNSLILDEDGITEFVGSIGMLFQDLIHVGQRPAIHECAQQFVVTGPWLMCA